MQNSFAATTVRLIGRSSLACACLLLSLNFSGCGKSDKNAAESNKLTARERIVASDTAEASGSVSMVKPSNGSGDTSSKEQAAAHAAAMTPAMRRDFERRYQQGLELMEHEEYTDATRIFEQLLSETSDPNDASVAEYCLAEIYFRNKSNQRALEAFKQIVEKYPGTPAAENAKAGIEYLENFQKHEEEYVSPEVEDRKRRGSIH